MHTYSHSEPRAMRGGKPLPHIPPAPHEYYVHAPMYLCTCTLLCGSTCHVLRLSVEQQLGRRASSDPFTKRSRTECCCYNRKNVQPNPNRLSAKSPEKSTVIRKTQQHHRESLLQHFSNTLKVGTQDHATPSNQRTTQILLSGLSRDMSTSL